MAWPKGKPRPAGAGRQKGSRNKRTQEVLDKAAELGITPLEVMLQTMRDAWDLATAPAEDVDMSPTDRLTAKMSAVAIAEKAAPYLHPRLASVESVNTNDTTVRTISADPPSAEEWEREYGGMATAAGSAKGPH
jgi:hypothetical protein